MTILFDTAAHLPMRASDWDPEKVRGVLARTCEEVEAARRPNGFWPVHAGDLDEPDPAATELRSLYNGAAGVIAGLKVLADGGTYAPRADLAALGEELHAAYLANPVQTPAPEPSYLIGESGVLLVAYRVAPSAAKADRLLALVRANADAPQRELLWGAPGTLVVAAFLRAWTQDPRWDEACLETIDRLWATWEARPDGDHLWTQDLYGERTRYLGAGHGLAGNVRALVGCWDLLGEARQAELASRVEGTLRHHARRVAGFASWPSRADSDPAKPPSVQWCHGAPGMVTSLAGIPVGLVPGLDDLLLQAGELTWRAGPVAKGVGLCHGTAGNGYALLALHRRTGDPSWLARARTFAMAAVGQYEAIRREQPVWCSLWTGDVGFACFLRDCLRGEGGIPGLDVL